MGVVYNLDKCRVPKYESVKPPLYIITPTYPRPVQIAELTRLAYLLQVRYFWGIHFFLKFSRINFYVDKSHFGSRMSKIYIGLLQMMHINPQ